MTLLAQRLRLGLLAAVTAVAGVSGCADASGGQGSEADDELPSWLPDRGVASDVDVTATAGPDLPEPLGHVVTLQDGTGIDVAAAALVANASFANADLFATHNGDGLRLSTGGPSPTVSRPVNWFIGADKKPQLFSTFTGIPAVLRDADMTAALPIAVQRVGFVLQTEDGGWARGWVRDVTWDSFTGQWRVDIEFGLLDVDESAADA